MLSHVRFFSPVAPVSSLLIPCFTGKRFANIVLLHRHIHLQHRGLSKTRHSVPCTPCLGAINQHTMYLKENRELHWDNGRFSRRGPALQPFPNKTPVSSPAAGSPASLLCMHTTAYQDFSENYRNTERKHIPIYLPTGCVHQCTPLAQLCWLTRRTRRRRN